MPLEKNRKKETAKRKRKKKRGETPRLTEGLETLFWFVVRIVGEPGISSMIQSDMSLRNKKGKRKNSNEESKDT